MIQWINVSIVLGNSKQRGLIVVDLTFLYVQYTKLETLFPMNLCWWFKIWWGPRTDLDLLPRWQLWATLVICINPRWPPEPVWKINCWANYLRMMYKTSFKGFRYAASISDIIFLFSGQGNVKIKMAVQRHLENGTLELFS